jgi:hypothetical protein
MENRVIQFKRLILSIILLVFFNCSKKKPCYSVQFDENKCSVSIGSPVFIGSGIVGYIDKINSSNDMVICEFCIPNSVRIPEDSKIYVGFIQSFGVNGIKIEEGKDLNYFSNKVPLNVIFKDSIELNFSASDSILNNNLIELFNKINQNQKSDSIHRNN